jgi:putative nucleotidyltransferase with HDIG domain
VQQDVREAQLDSGRARAELRRLVGRLESRHPSTHGHSRRVAAHSAAIAVELGLAAAAVARIRTAALLHDVGKIEVPAEIVDKPAPLTDDEYATIRRHANAGARMVEALGDPAVTTIVRHHHERFDGTGYPARLQGYEIPLGARIVAVADTFDALISPRPYRPQMSERRALGLLEAAAGNQLDPTVVAVALRLAAPRRRRRRHGRFAQPPGSDRAAAPAPPARQLPG